MTSSRDRPTNLGVEHRIHDLLTDARAARDAGDWRLTQSLANAVLALDPTNTAAKSLTAGFAVRRQMTLLFCDIVGSTQLADARDPEDVTALLGAYRAICTEIIDRFGGFIDDHRGDGMLVLFGFPQVNEDDARRAVRCAQAIIAALPRRLQALLGRDHNVGLAVRIAVHTDLVVLDGVGVAGATANEAARLQDFAKPNTVVVSDATKALVWPYFETASSGIVELRGVSRPMEIFTVLRERSTAERGLVISPFVGRESELSALRRFLTGRLPLLLVTGQAGVGKTRLVSEASRRYDLPVVECRCSRFHQNTSLQVFRPVIEDGCGIDESDTPEGRLTKLRARVGQDMVRNGDLPFLSTALDIPMDRLAAPVAVDPDLLRRNALRAAAAVVAATVRAPGHAVLFVDDVHWADQSSLDLISQLVAERPEGMRLVLTARDGFEPSWPDDQYQTLNLAALGYQDLKELGELMPEGSGMPAEDLDELIERSDGIPLFLEELLRTADALGRGQIVHRSIRFGDYQIPPALLDPLLARLASPQVDLELAQLAATIGRDMDRDLLHGLAGGTGVEFQGRVETLLAAGLLETSDDGLRFRHELIREAAYETQKRSTRRRNHSAVADAMGQRTPTPRLAGERALHLERAGRYTEAITAHLQAAIADQSVGAHIQVTTRLTHTLELVDLLPPGPDKLHTELQIRGMRSFSAVTAGGYGVPEAAIDYRRSSELCEMLVGVPESIPALINTWSYYAFRGELKQADEVVEALVRECQAAGNPLPAGEVGFGTTEFLRGHYDRSRQLLEDFLRSGWGDTTDRPPPSWQLPGDPIAALAGHLAFIRWIGGNSDATRVLFEDAHRRANGLEFPFGAFSACYIHHFEALVHTLQGDYRALAEIGSQMKDSADRHGFALWQLTAALHLELSAINLGDHEVVDQFAEHVSMVRVVLVSDAYSPYWLTQLGAAQHLLGQTQDALRNLDQALEVADRTESEFFSAETLRIRGRILVESGDPIGIDSVQKAVDLAVRQGAPALAARARATLADLVAR